MEKFFGLKPTVMTTATKTVSRTMRKKISGNWRTIHYLTTVSAPRSVTNPDYARAAGWALAWHKASPPQYQGNC